MAKQEKLKSSGQSRYSGALHTSLHEAMYELLTALTTADQSKWQLTALLTTYRQSIDVENDINRETAASADTKDLATLDQQRDALISFLFERIRTDRLYHPLEATQKAAYRLSLITKTYSGLQREGYQEQTVHTTGLLNDFGKTESFQDLQTLGINAFVSQLKTVNDNFKQLYATRSVARTQTKLPSSREQRAITDATFAEIINHINASYVFADAAERERINLLIRLMNGRIDDHRARHNQTTGSTSTNKGENTGGNTTPSTGGTTNTGGTTTWSDGTPRADGE